MIDISAINFNALAWRSPKHGDEYGYMPGDEWYNEIIEWLKTGTKIWVEKGGQVVTSRVRFPNSAYDAIVEYDPNTKMISWTFRKMNEFHI